MLPDQTTTLNESWLCFINRRENIRNADTNNFLIFISYSSFKVRFISQCNLHLKSRTRAVKLQKKYWNSRKSNFAASRIYILFFFEQNSIWNLPLSAFLRNEQTRCIFRNFFLSFLLANWFSWMIWNWFFSENVTALQTFQNIIIDVFSHWNFRH